MPSISDLLNTYSADIVRAQIRKIVEIYDYEWIVFHELIQNAIDAVQVNQDVTEGLISFDIDFEKRELIIKDNGIGFPSNLELLVPGGSGAEKRLKSRSPSKGYQGVGLKAVMYSTEKFSIKSDNKEQIWEFSVDDLYSYLDDESPAIPEYNSATQQSSSDESYTIIRAVFPEQIFSKLYGRLNHFIHADTVKWYDLYKFYEDLGNGKPYLQYAIHFFRWYFRTQSYVGCINRLLNIPVKNHLTEVLEEIKPIKIDFTFKSSNNFDSVKGMLGDWLQKTELSKIQTTIENRFWDYSEIAAENNEKASKYRIAPKIITTKPNDENWEMLSVGFRDGFLDLKIVPDFNKSEFCERYKDINYLLERPRSSVNVHDFKDVIEKITGIYLCIGRTSSHELLGNENKGIRLIAANGVPTAHTLTASSTSSTWYLETITMIINVDASLNLGKRHLASTRLVRRLNEFFEACYPNLVKYSKLFVERPSSSTPDIELPDVLGSRKLDREKLNFKRFPSDENTLIGIFSSVISIVDPEFSIYGFFGAAVFDGKFSWTQSEIRSELELQKVEFKVKLSKLISEFDLATHGKEFDQLALIIDWDRNIDIPGWSVKGISTPRKNQLEGKNIPTRYIQYVLENRQGNYRPLICVADLVANNLTKLSDEDDLDKFIDEMN